MTTKEPTFTPTQDVVEDYKDGSGSVVVAKAGKPIPWAMARNLGLVKGDPPKAEGKTKADEPDTQR